MFVYSFLTNKLKKCVHQYYNFGISRLNNIVEKLSGVSNTQQVPEVDREIHPLKGKSTWPSIQNKLETMIDRLKAMELGL